MQETTGTLTVARAYRMRVYPTRAQQNVLARLGGATRYLWNQALARRTSAYKVDGTKLNWISLSRWFTELRSTPETAWLGELPREPFNQVLRDQERAFANFFAKRAKYPRFRRRGGRVSMRFTIDQRRADRMVERGDGRWAFVSLPGLGRLKLRRTEDLFGRLRSITLRREAGRWFAAITADGVEAPPAPAPKRALLGVDAGLKDLLVAGDGSRVPVPTTLRTKLKRLRRYQRHYVRQRDAAARRQGLDPRKPFSKGTRIQASHRMFGTRRSIAKLHARVAAVRRETMHAATTSIVRRAAVIAIEDLAVRAMNRGMGRHAFRRSAANAALGELRRQIVYKAAWYGREVVLVNRWYPSSKTCSHCGQVYKGLTLNERTWTCAACGTEHDRDLNAAYNLEAYAQRALTATGMRPESDARGESSAARSTKVTSLPERRRSVNRERAQIGAVRRIRARGVRNAPSSG